MRQEDYSYLDVAVRGGVAYVGFGHPEKERSYRRDVIADLDRLPRDLAADTEVHVAILTGAGDTFSLGLAPDDYAQAGSHRGAEYDWARADLRAWLDLDKPVIAAINGVVHGAPLTKVLTADIVLAERHVRFCDFHVPAGFIAATGAFLWPPSVGLLRSKRWIMTGDWIGADEAERIGLLTEVVPTGTLMARAEEYAQRFIALPQASLRYTKQVMNQWLRRALPDIFEPALALEIIQWDDGLDSPLERRQALTDEATETARLAHWSQQQRD
jgi:enoyl-CoA hydratase